MRLLWEPYRLHIYRIHQFLEVITEALLISSSENVDFLINEETILEYFH